LKNTIPFRVRPMLATLVREPFHEHGWIYEEKYDGYRILAYKEGKRVKLMSRNAIDRTARFPHIAEAIRKLRHDNLLFDGEVAVFDRKEVSRFQLLQKGAEESVYAVFDCLYLEGHDLRTQQLNKRRGALEDSIGTSRVLMRSRILNANGLESYKIAKRRGYEGVVAKDFASPYVERRSGYWRKIKVHEEDEFIIVGFTEPAGSRKHFGALLLGGYREGKLYYAGKVGTGFDERTLTSVYGKLRPLLRKRLDLMDAPRGPRIHFVEPRLVAQISYQEWTADNKLRQPVFLGLRDDKKHREVTLPEI
jgi:bifunctional non-homologous end joining protein LigD